VIRGFLRCIYSTSTDQASGEEGIRDSRSANSILPDIDGGSESEVDGRPTEASAHIYPRILRQECNQHRPRDVGYGGDQYATFEDNNPQLYVRQDGAARLKLETRLSAWT
jgi:hypothetical protein